MTFFTGCAAAAVLALAATAAEAQVPARPVPRAALITVSDFDGPYGVPEAPPPRAYGYRYDERGPAPVLLPPEEVYAVLRDNGFSPLGVLRLRGNVYTIAVIDRRGEDGRLVIDASDGRILRFTPAGGPEFGIGPAYDGQAVEPYGPRGALPRPTVVRGFPPRPPAPIPHVASRTVPVPRAAPPRGEAPVAAARPVTAEPARQLQAPQQSAAAQPAETAVPTVGQAKPAATIQPTQDMPPVQALE